MGGTNLPYTFGRNDTMHTIKFSETTGYPPNSPYDLASLNYVIYGCLLGVPLGCLESILAVLRKKVTSLEVIGDIYYFPIMH